MIANIKHHATKAIKNTLKLFLPGWWLPKGTKNADESNLERASSSCEHWAIAGAALVIGSVVGEFAIAHGAPSYRLFLKLSEYPDAGIALGIVGEVALGTIWNNRIQTELRKRSNDKLATAMDRAALAETELREFRRPRRDIFAPHRAAFVSAISTLKGTPFDAAIDRGGEVMHFWWDLAHALSEAGWNHIPWVDRTGMFTQQFPLPVSGMGSGTNVEIHLHPQSRATLEPAARALLGALNAAGIVATDEGFNLHTQNTGAVHIVIGIKG